MTIHRNDTFQAWLKSLFSGQVYSVEKLTGDAGFRHYSRINFAHSSYIAVDAEPSKSNNHAFVQISEALNKASINAPKVIHREDTQGFYCLSDLGSCLLSDLANSDNMPVLYQRAIDTLIRMLSISHIPNYELPDYDADFVAMELAIFPEWLLSQYLNIHLDETEKQQLTACFEVLINNAIEQPKYFMHRDYHSRNIMLNDQQDIAVIDFQDAVRGPISYDVVSLLRDCYIQWPDTSVDKMFNYFKVEVTKKFDLKIENAVWQRWFDLMGIQRHIKASGIFARLHHRDGKNGYLADIPLTLNYIVDISKKYPELQFLEHLILTKVIPAIEGDMQ